MVFREFIITYVMLGVIILLLLSILILLIIVLRRTSNDIPVSSFMQHGGGMPIQAGGAMQTDVMSAPPIVNVSAARTGISVCKNCGMQFDSVNNFCPKCGTSKS